MKKVYQTKLGKGGNCLVACIASFLDKKIDEIPFTICRENTWSTSLKEYLISEGYEYEEIYNHQEQVYFNNLIYAKDPEYDLNYNIDFYNELKKNKSSENFLERFEEESKNPTSFNGYLIVSGVSPRDPSILHAVIYKDGKLFHDPTPNGGGVKNIISYKIIRKIENQELYQKYIAKIKSDLIIKKYNIEQFKKEIDEFFQIIIENKGVFIKDAEIIKESETITELENNIYKAKFDKEIEILKKLHNEIEHKSFSKTILKEIEEIYSKIEKEFENLKKEVNELHNLTKQISKESHSHDHTFITKIENLKKEINEEEHILNKMINELETIKSDLDNLTYQIYNFKEDKVNSSYYKHPLNYDEETNYQSLLSNLNNKYKLNIDYVFLHKKNITEITSDVWKSIKKANDPLREYEHIALFNEMWNLANFKRNNKINISENLKLKIIKSRHNLSRYDLVLGGHIEGSNINDIILKAKLNKEEESEIWSIFHKLWGDSSSRNCDKVDDQLEIYKLIDKKLSELSKIKVLDAGCGKNGNGISSLSEKYNNKIEGYGIDLNIEEYPSNVNLQKANLEKLPFENNFFDIIYSSHVIYYFKDEKLLNVIKEILRVLKPNGFFVFNDSDFSNYKNNIIPSIGFKADLIKQTNSILIIKL